MSQFFKFDSLANFVGIFVGVFTVLTIIYSVGFMRGRRNLALYYLYIILTCLVSLAAVFTNDLLLFIVFWGFLALLLYLLINFGKKQATPETAKKAFIIIGGTDALMLLGLGLILGLTGTRQMDKVTIALTGKTAIWAYLCLVAAAFAKAGAMPFHTWVPDTAEDAPAPVTAYLPASLDKLLGIYLLARVSQDMFQMNSWLGTLLMFAGSITIIAAVMMALIQHDFKRLLGYHAVSQVGYMVLGIGTGNPIGIAGGLFHMVNHAIYKSCLFFCSGSVEKQSGTTDLEKLGGRARTMPITFITFLIASLAISGVPPFNGFVSKWMVYQGVIETAKSGGLLWIVWLVAAMFGSALTLASFMKLIHTVFLGQPSSETVTRSEVGPAMWLPTVILSTLCIIFGVFAWALPLKFILPAVRGQVEFFGVWQAGLASLLLVLGVGLGALIYLLGAIKVRETDSFAGGEKLEDHPQLRVSGVGFYNTIKEMKPLGTIYRLALAHRFDLYDQLKGLCLQFTRWLRIAHSGLLPTYLLWVLAGVVVLLMVLV